MPNSTIDLDKRTRMPIQEQKKGGRVRLVVADDNKEVRDKVVQLLRADFDVIGTAGDGGSACEAVFLLEPDIVILDISMSVMSGIEAARKIKRKGAKTKAIFLTVHEDPDFVRVALRAGARGYVVKSHMASDLIAAINAALEDKLFVLPVLHSEINFCELLTRPVCCFLSVEETSATGPTLGSSSS
jgi:DNA-binding NarL/FixJ family response regulator